MRRVCLSLALPLICGCAAKHTATMQQSRPQTADLPAAAALVFTPPIAADHPIVYVPRDMREPAIFVGFEEPSTTFLYIRTDDRQSDDYTDRYTRRATIEKIGVSYR